MESNQDSRTQKELDFIKTKEMELRRKNRGNANTLVMPLMDKSKLWNKPKIQFRNPSYPIDLMDLKGSRINQM